MKLTLLRFFSLVLTVSASLHSYAQEMILSYHSDITIAQDASMEVTETIRVRAEGVQIQRGIYRDFPTRYRDRLGNRIVVDFELLSATRDGAPEFRRTENLSNGVRIYLGNADVLLQPGEYTYTITYRTDRQLGYFENHDELYWNVTGNGWAFQIQEASATVTLPAAVPASQLTMEGYTGRFGESGQNYVASVEDGGGSIRTTTSLLPEAGLTLAMTWPKGIVREPGGAERIRNLLSDNAALLASLLTLLAATVYLYFAWSHVGKDPDSGTIFPHYTPPEGYSPASARFISRMGYDMKVFTAAVINLAVKGHVEIAQHDKDFVLGKTFSKAELAPGEKIVLDKLFIEGEVLELEKENHETVMAAIKAHRKALRRDYLGTYFAKNSGFIVPSFLLTIGVLVGIALFDAISVAVVLVFMVIIGVHGVFAYLLKAPSVRGRLLMDKLEGFKLYLEVAEEDDLNLKHPPDKTPELFERLLPYAVALDVAEEWAGKFTAAFAKLQSQSGVAYQPVWYRGHFDASNMGAFSKNISTTINSSITSASSPPGSSSGAGGGGFSGGGGGGGGGGGW